MNLTYSMIIRWSDADAVYIAHLPEFGDAVKTHGETYEEAARNGREVMEMLVEDFIRNGEKLPVPDKYIDEELTTPARRSRKRPQLARQR